MKQAGAGLPGVTEQKQLKSYKSYGVQALIFVLAYFWTWFKSR
jgi:hypothetical protein